MYIKASCIEYGKTAAGDFAAAKTGRILGLEDDKFRLCGTGTGPCPVPSTSAAGKPTTPFAAVWAIRKKNGIKE